MKANEFVKKFGIAAASELVNESEWSIKQLALATTTSMLDLKRLVESYELVESYGGLDKAKLLLRMRIAAELYESADELKQAIADVESCQ